VAALASLLSGGNGKAAAFAPTPAAPVREREAPGDSRHLLDDVREELLERERRLLSDILALLQVCPSPLPNPLAQFPTFAEPVQLDPLSSCPSSSRLDVCFSCGNSLWACKPVELWGAAAIFTVVVVLAGAFKHWDDALRGVCKPIPRKQKGQ
jgi:hypothetical protein